ncbi:hypothetical protein scyTo_0001979 [Scyliorhinus torazame]|uniref:Uncharacterized protein n=1 Tax=Scyliorhinus torazame TaxID=75743 RepID=A0A401PGZ6_SCYTO|nr:hypothetical protein [Scyliorhinus torazame]
MNLNGDYLQLILALQCTHMLLQVIEGEPDGIEVSQTPSEVKASEGQSINMECSWAKDLQVESIFIEIPAPVRRGSGNGTQLTVQAGEEKVNYWPVLGVFVLLALSVLVILYYKKRQKSQRNSTMPVPIDVMREEIHEENNENEGNEENSTSRGSSQWEDEVKATLLTGGFAVRGRNLAANNRSRVR